MRKLVLSAWLCFASIAPTSGATHKILTEEPIATVAIPDKWQTTERADNIEAISPESALHFLIVVPEGRKIAEAMGEAMRYLRNSGGIVVQAESMKKEPGKLNGMETQNVSWNGKDKNGDIKIRFRIIPIAEDKSLLAASWASPAAEKKHQAELDKMLKSIKKL